MQGHIKFFVCLVFLNITAAGLFGKCSYFRGGMIMNTENNNKKKLLMKSAVAFTFALTMFAANAGGEAFAEEAMTAARTGVNVNQDEAETDEDVTDGDSADNGDGTKDITTNYDAAEEDTEESPEAVTEDTAVSEDDEVAVTEETIGENADTKTENTEETVTEENVNEENTEEASEDEEAAVTEEAVAVYAASSRFTGSASDYNVFVRGDYSVNGADISSNGKLGNIAAGGNVSIPDNYTAGKAVVGGELSGSFLNGTSDEESRSAFVQL